MILGKFAFIGMGNRPCLIGFGLSFLIFDLNLLRILADWIIGAAIELAELSLALNEEPTAGRANLLHGNYRGIRNRVVALRVITAAHEGLACALIFPYDQVPGFASRTLHYILGSVLLRKDENRF